METRDAAALTWTARLFLAIGLAATAACVSFTVGTLQFVSESTKAEGTVVDWTQGGGTAGRSAEPGAYYRVIEVVAEDGRRVRGEDEIGVDMSQLRVGERLTVRYRPDDPTRMRVVSLSGLWLEAMVTAVLAVAFGGSGLFLLRQIRSGQV